METKSKLTVAEIYVVKGNNICLLSYDTATNLGLVTVHVQQITSTNILEANEQKRPLSFPHVLQKYPNIFNGIGQLKNFKLKLHIDKTVPPVAQPARKIPFHMRQKVKAAIEKLEQDGIIEKVEGPTPWVSPLVVTPKKDGDVRLCVDMRMANRAIQRERHPSPTVDDLVHKLNGTTVFSKLDLHAGYHQLLLDEESRYITTFETHKGLRRYRTLNFGTCSASEIFQKVIGDQIRDIPCTMNFSDDVIVYGRTQAEHDTALEAVFHRFAERGLTLHRKKCEFSKPEITFFGFVFSARGISLDPQKAHAIKTAPAPTTQTGLRSFLGMATYCSKFIKNFSDLTQPLLELTKKNTIFRWLDCHEQAFNAVKSALICLPVLSYFDKTKTTELVTDASPFGLSAILSQCGAGETDRTCVAHISRALTDVEKRYSQTEREALAIVWAIERLHLYLYGGKFTLITDCKPLEMILNNPASKSPARIERWYLRLQDYDFDIKYIKGTDNPSDFLSRHISGPNVNYSTLSQSAEEYVNFISTHAVPITMTLTEIQEETDKDPTLSMLRTLIHNNSWHTVDNVNNPSVIKDELKLFYKLKDELTVADNAPLILRGSRLVLPQSLRKKAIELAHEGHQGIVKTKRLLREKIWFPNIDKTVEEMVQRCIPCQATGRESSPQPLQMVKLPPSPWHTVNIDFCGPFPSQDYFLVVIDAHSRFPEVDIVSSTSAAAALPKLERIFATHGIPEVIKTDNSPPFPGKDFYQFIKDLGSRHKPSTPLWPHGNAEAENFMKPLEKAVRTAVVENKNWKRVINRFLLNYRATPHSTTGKSPAELLFNRKIRTRLPEMSSQETSPSHLALQQKDDDAKKKMKEYADKKSRAKESPIRVGDSVLVRQAKENKLFSKFKPNPYRVVKMKGTRVTVERHGHFITRNISHYKKLPDGAYDFALQRETDEDLFLDDNDTPEEGVENQREQRRRYPVRDRHAVRRYGQNIFDT